MQHEGDSESNYNWYPQNNTLKGLIWTYNKNYNYDNGSCSIFWLMIWSNE